MGASRRDLRPRQSSPSESGAATAVAAEGKANVAATLGGWSVRHRAIAICGWLLFVVVASLGAAAGQRQMTVDEYAEGDSAQAVRVLDQAGIKPGAGEMVFVHSDVLTADGTDFQTAVHELVSGLQNYEQVTGLRDPYAAGLISADRHSALVQFTMLGDASTAWQRIQPVLDAVAAVRAAHPQLRVEQFGAASANKWFNDTVLRDFHRAEWTAVPLAIGILLVAFGALLAAVLPVGLAMTAFFAANGLLALISHGLHVDSSTSSVMLLLGLAVGVDYSLFYLRREREERAAGKDAATALRIAAATSGRSVLVSGATVVVAMSGMFLSGMLIFDGFALATIIVVLISMLGSVTVLPATLSLLGDRVELGRIPGTRRMRRHPGDSRVWAAVLRRVLARPRLLATVSAAFLLALAAPMLGVHTEKLGLDKQLPAGTSIVEAYHDIAAAFPGGPTPAQVVVQADDVLAAPVQQALADFTASALRTGLVNQPIRATTYAGQHVVVIAVPLAGNGTDSTSQRALQTLRSEVIPATLSTMAGVHAYVAGDLAFSSDFNHQLRSSIGPVLVFVMGLAFLLMLYSFRSVTIAVVSIVLNLLSVAASFGVIVSIFQHGWGASLVGTQGVGAIESWLPLFAFVVLFGLSMDYHVFVVSRIREAHDRGLSTRDAVAQGIRSTAGVVTSAALIMVGVFAVLGSLSMQDFKQLGVGLAVAILLDATVVRTVLLPSVLTLLGERTWYLPRWLARLGLGRRADAAAPAAHDRLGRQPAPAMTGGGATSTKE
jgi:RND superfamily putative drug exporter